MRIKIGSVWECIEEDSDLFGKFCVVEDIDDDPDLNGDGTIELMYADGSKYYGKVRRFIPGITHKLREEQEA
ncbi:hypothetical protein AV654_17895 [Paenibacillus elgii]|uniref:Uncharacterized protein n=1 Tax=Paenibacillus elgii TaxID=189691 RepID=A0A165R6Z7_9BACL|nr:hypothetical protein [Paenibacillus elgii]KZE79342.1 hypothetical protein AV654_17895 [Paenibacillus elgii]